uniref:DUF3116 domain-containing protein n=1 Tax=Angiostrongylus cantonensis TaxID=6313 RepID=A0A0K0CXI7_ANGCA
MLDFQSREEWGSPLYWQDYVVQMIVVKNSRMTLTTLAIHLTCHEKSPVEAQLFLMDQLDKPYVEDTCDNLDNVGWITKLKRVERDSNVSKCANTK